MGGRLSERLRDARGMAQWRLVLWRSLVFGRLALWGGLLHSSVSRKSKCWKRRTGKEVAEYSALIHRNPRGFMSPVDNLVRFQKHKLQVKALCFLSNTCCIERRTGRCRSRSARSGMHSTPI
jgi:hypothetical protein